MWAWLEKTNNHTAEYLRMQAEYEAAKAEWDKAHPDGVFSFAEFPPLAPSRVSYNKYGISLNVYGKAGSYDIFPWDRVDSKDAILWWVRELGGKTWSDGRLIKDFVELTLAYVNGTLSFEKEAEGKLGTGNEESGMAVGSVSGSEEVGHLLSVAKQHHTNGDEVSHLVRKEGDNSDIHHSSFIIPHSTPKEAL